MALCLGGEGALVEDEWVPFVNSLDIEAVAFDVTASGTGAGVRGMNFGTFSLSPLILNRDTGGCSSRIFLRLCMVRFAMQLSEDEDSSTGGVIGLCNRVECDGCGVRRREGEEDGERFFPAELALLR